MKNYLLIIFVFSSTVDAQNNLTIFGGWFNLSRIQYNNDTFDEMMDVNILRRNNFGIEIRFKNIITGLAFTQRGFRYKTKGSLFNVEFNTPDENSPFNVLLFPLFLDFIPGSRLYGYEVFNLVSLHTLYLIKSNDKIELFSGLQTGFPIGGEFKASKSYLSSFAFDGDNTKSTNMNIDAGLLIGVNAISSNRNFGFRFSYYLGMTNFKRGISRDNNYKNRTLSLSILLHL